MILPDLTDEDEADALRADPAWLAQILGHFEGLLRLQGPGFAYPRGSCVVGRYGPDVLKVFFPMDGAHAAVEARVLQHLDGKLPIDTPPLRATGVEQGWPWLLMGALDGEDLIDRYPTLDGSARLRLGRQLGEVLATLHSLPLLEQPALDWPAWSEAQVRGAAERQKRAGGPPHLVEAVDAYLSKADLEEGPRGIALLHTEVMTEHLKVAERSGQWRLTGLFDFEPAMVAPVDYEFGSVGLFFSGGEAAVLHAVFDGYGIADRSEALTHRLFSLALIHRYAHLPFWLRRSPAPSSSLESLAAHWFGFDR